MIWTRSAIGVEARAHYPRAPWLKGGINEIYRHSCLHFRFFTIIVFTNTPVRTSSHCITDTPHMYMSGVQSFIPLTTNQLTLGSKLFSMQI